MNKIELVQSYIDRCEMVIDANDSNMAEALQNEIIGVFEAEIDGLTAKLDNYSTNVAYTVGYIVDYIGDLNLLKRKLLNYISTLYQKQKNANYELELARLSQPSMTQTTNVTVNVTIEQTIDRINQLSPDSLSDADKEGLIGSLYDIEKYKNTKNKGKAWDVAKKVLAFLADKGADAAVAALPLIIQGLQAL